MASIIFLNGASSAGKTTLANALQAQLPRPFWHVSFDTLRDSGALPMARFQSRDFDWADHRTDIFEGFHAGLAAWAGAGNDLIVTHVLDTDGWHRRLQMLLRGHDLFFVGVHTPEDVLTRREAARGDRAPGSATSDIHIVHKGLRYDLEVSGNAVADDVADTLLSAWAAPRPASAFFDPA